MCLIRSRNCLTFVCTWFNLRFFLGPCYSYFQLFILSYYVSFCSELRIVMSVIVSVYKRCLVCLCFQLILGWWVFGCGGVRHLLICLACVCLGVVVSDTYLFALLVFVWVWWCSILTYLPCLCLFGCGGVRYLLICLACVCLGVVVSDTFCVLFFFVFSAMCCRFLWIVLFLLSFRYSLTLDSRK
jgi:hypothetical protein